MSEHCGSNFSRELISRMAENVTSVELTEHKWAPRVSNDDFMKLDRLRTDMIFILKGFGEFNEGG